MGIISAPRTDADRTALQEFEDEVIDRLYVLNAERAREEERLGLRAKRGSKGKAKAKGGKPRKSKAPAPADEQAPDEQGELF